MKNKQIKLGMILQYSQMAISVLISLIYTPLMLKMLGQSEYGLYNLSSSIISYLSMLSLGVGSSYIHYFFVQKKQNPDGIKSLNGMYLTIFVIIGIVALVCGLILSQNVSIFFNDSYSIKDIDTASILMIFLSINLAISFPMSLFTNFLTAHEEFIIQKLLNIGKTILSPVLSIIALFMGFGSIGLVLITTIVSIVIDISNIIYCFGKLGMKISFKGMKFKLIKEILVFSIFVGINYIVDQINWQTDKIILGKMISSSAVSIYAVGSSLNYYFMSFGVSVSSLFGPKVNEIVQKGSNDMDRELTDLMIKVARIQSYILLPIFFGFVFFGKQFVLYWAGDGYEESYYVALILISTLFPDLIQNVGIEIQKAKNLHHFRSYVYLAMAIINVLISILLCKFLGIIGVSIGTGISFVAANLIAMNIYYEKVIKIDIKRFWHSFFKTSKFIIFPIIFGVIYTRFAPQTPIYFIIGLIIFVIIYLISLYALSISHNEKERMLVKHKKTH